MHAPWPWWSMVVHADTHSARSDISTFLAVAARRILLSSSLSCMRILVLPYLLIYVQPYELCRTARSPHAHGRASPLLACALAVHTLRLRLVPTHRRSGLPCEHTARA
jgi:hypothetical protein